MIRRMSCLSISLLILSALAFPARNAAGQTTADARTPLILTLEEAVQIAFERNYTLRDSRLNIADANAQVREAWGEVMPQVTATSSYQRNVKSANPFAGSDAGGFFESFGYVDWLAYNEGARTDADPSTEPITLDEFRRRQMEGYSEAGISPAFSGNPFAVDNQFASGISITQSIYNRSAFAAIKGAGQLKRINQIGADRTAQILRNDVHAAFYSALLAEKQAQVVANSVARIVRTVDETQKQLAQGTASKFQRLTAEVELANLETNLIQATNQADLALNSLKMLLGIPIDQPLQLRGSLEVDEQVRFTRISMEDAVQLALQNRHDLEQAAIAVELNEVNREITRSTFYPNLSAFADFNYMGNVPDNRTLITTDPDDPFSFASRQRGFFSQSYWNPSVAVGLRMSWTIFDGFQRSARLQRSQIEVQRAEIGYEQTVEAVKLEVEQAMRNLQTAERMIQSQQRNVDRAELNYDFALTRLREGVSSQLEERQASDLLDQSQLSYLQAVHDYLVAKTNFETAIGATISDGDTFRFTSR